LRGGSGIVSGIDGLRRSEARLLGLFRTPMESGDVSEELADT
jgi:hypothetical protein